MDRIKFPLPLITALFLVLPWIALNYLADQLSAAPFLPFSLFNWMTPLIPGPLITFGIDAMIDTLLFLRIDVANSAKAAEQGLAVLAFVVLGTGVGWPIIQSFTGRRKVIGWLIGIAFSAFLMAITWPWENPLLAAAVLGLLLLAWLLSAWLAGKKIGAISELPEKTEADSQEISGMEGRASVRQVSRRQFLLSLGAGTASVTVIGAGLGLILAGRGRRDTASGGTSELSRNLPNADDPVSPAPGTRREYTPVEDHYKVFLQLEPMEIDGATWMLPLVGLVDAPLMLTVDDLYNRFESFEQYVTLSCISGRVGTTLISTTKWTGISMQDVLDAAGVQPEARYLYIESADGFYESVPLELIRSDRRIMLCHSWDDAPLPSDHGFPCRIWIPDRFGMKQPKWIVHMELTEEYRPGYWVERNWSETALVKATSVIDTIAVDDVGIVDGEQVVPVGGIAWAGDRQISGVQVRVDGGEWQDALLRSPLSETTWVIWRFDWPFQEGNHTFEVRCLEGDGTAQIAEVNSARPDGATGIHSREIDI